MTQVINLRTRRKQAARNRHRQSGTENAARHGRAAAEKARQAGQAEREARHLDGHRRGPDED